MLVNIPALLLVTAGGKMACHLNQSYKVMIVRLKTLGKGKAQLLVLCLVRGTVAVQW